MGYTQGMARSWLSSLTLLFAGLTLLPGGETAKLRRFTFEEPHMGTLFRLVFYTSDEAAAQQAAKEAFARIAELNRIMSDYLADSELTKLCQQAGGSPVEVSDDLFAVLAKAEEIATATDGAFDVSVGPVVRLWRKARKEKALPDPQALKVALARVDFHKIKLDPQRRTVQLLIMGMLLDLGGIAKGYAADAALAALHKRGIDRALVAAGGDVRVALPPPEAKGWKIGIAPLQDPKAEPTAYLLLKNAAVSTSGDAHQHLEIDGKRYSHVVDPRTGIGLLGRRAVTVIAPDSTTADALATAACVLGPEKGLQLVQKQASCAAMFVWETAAGVHTKTTSRFASYIMK
jgi:thiamine biosynthesis lipoprotein